MFVKWSPVSRPKLGERIHKIQLQPSTGCEVADSTKNVLHDKATNKYTKELRPGQRMKVHFKSTNEAAVGLIKVLSYNV